MTPSTETLKEFNEEVREARILIAKIKLERQSLEEQKKDFEIEKAEYQNLIKAIKTVARGRFA